MEEGWLYLTTGDFNWYEFTTTILPVPTPSLASSRGPQFTSPAMATVFVSGPLCLLLALTAIFPLADGIRCYQCSSDEDKSNDICGAYARFDTSRNTMVDCLSNEADVPGTFCYKSIQQGPRGFIWDGRWRTVERRCAQVSERGISWGCDWGYDQNGVYWEKCYCAEDGCNSTPRSTYFSISLLLLTMSTLLLTRIAIM